MDELKKSLKKNKILTIVFSIVILAMIIIDCIFIEKMNILTYISCAIVYMCYGFNIGVTCIISKTVDIIEKTDKDD